MSSLRRSYLAAVILLAAAGTVIGCLGSSSTSEVAPPLDPTATRHSVTVTVNDVRVSTGNLVFGIYASEGGFPSSEAAAVAWETKPAENGQTFTVALPPGHYAASVLHDANSNGRMDTKLLGIPKEAYGVSNNPKPRFRAATFDEARFQVGEDAVELVIELQHF